MEAKAVLNYTRISPRKVGLVLDLIRNKPVDLAAAILKHTPKAACEDLEKLLKSAVANAERIPVLRDARTHPEADPSQRPRKSVPGA